MKTYLIIILTTFCSSMANASDASSAAATSAAVIGTAAAVGSVSYRNWLTFELKDWKDSATQTTSQLTRQCDMDTEVRLLGNARYNLLYVAIKNGTKLPYLVRPGRIRFVFSNGRERMPSFPFQNQSLELKPGITSGGTIPFPSKWEFENQDSVSAVIPLFSAEDKEFCTITVNASRPEGVPQQTSSFTEYTTLDYSFEFGTSLLRTGDPGSTLSAGKFTFGLSFYIYPWVNHGMNFGLGIENMGNQGDPILNSISGSYSSGSLNSFWGQFGYSHRRFLSRRTQLIYDIDLGGHNYRARVPESKLASDVSNSFLLFHKLSLDYMFGSFGYGVVIENAIGLSLYQGWITGGHIGTQSASGTFLGAAVRYKFGF
ncbi:MAG: hypothetical protein A2Z97_08600 [Bdellovibrionales bacterium GWB1_52_6]|nr:MAG: hypothetical protein A2Z97_08600 [Bdellovibrionales bacterium GWB1_52_6]OFZ02416.1 MAG: hypothetical protein A2X97_12765 [Bdellovibrionales bacterium GWA1_52_35]HCM41555.1 hypothetical protein [Bdellovibrionales bacterium]